MINPELPTNETKKQRNTEAVLRSVDRGGSTITRSPEIREETFKKSRNRKRWILLRKKTFRKVGISVYKKLQTTRVRRFSLKNITLCV